MPFPGRTAIEKSMKTPVEIRRVDASGITIRWSDGTVQTISSERLRRACPCADCKERRGEGSHSKPLYGAPAEAGGTKAPPARRKPGALKVVDSTLDEQLRLERIWGVGNYAISIEWGDRHSTGIYSYRYLESFGEEDG